MIMKNAYDGIEPKARLCCTAGVYSDGQGGFIWKESWYVSTPKMSVFPDALLHRWEAETEAVAAMEAEGYTCTKRHDFRGDYYECIHGESAAALETEMVARAREDERWATNAEKGFIRFGKCPKSGKSHNYREGFDEAGVSCYNALFMDGKYRLILTEAQTVQVYTYAVGRDTYRLWGDVIGTGSDGEPLLKVRREEIIEKCQK